MSALAKLVIKEPESAELAEWLGKHAGIRKASSMLCRVELPLGGVAYDQRLLEAAKLIGLPVESPGRE